MSNFRALVLSQGPDRKVSGVLETLPEDKLPAGDVTVAVEYSTLNYKDGLVLTSGGGLVKTWPHVGGIDFAGTVDKSDNPTFKPGDKVVMNGWRVGELHWGGYATKARVKGDWLVKLPASISTKRAMAIGTAGFTAAMSVVALEERGLDPADGPVLVTGASGGVGGTALAILADRGYPYRTPPSVQGAPEPALVLGITRQESGFDPYARSSANARGMMQLLPATAQTVQGKHQPLQWNIGRVQR